MALTDLIPFGRKNNKELEDIADASWPARALFSKSCRTSCFSNAGTDGIEWLEAGQDDHSGKWHINKMQWNGGAINATPYAKGDMLSFKRMMITMARFEQESLTGGFLPLTEDRLTSSLANYHQTYNTPHYETAGLKEGIVFDATTGMPSSRLNDVFTIAGTFDARKAAMARQRQGDKTLISVWTAFESENGIESLLESNGKYRDYFAVETTRELISRLPKVLRATVRRLKNSNEMYLIEKFDEGEFDRKQSLYKNGLGPRTKMVDQYHDAIDDFGPMTTRMKLHCKMVNLFCYMYILRHAISVKNPSEYTLFAIGDMKKRVTKTCEELKKLGKSDNDINDLTFILANGGSAQDYFRDVEAILDRIQDEADLFTKLLGTPQDWRQLAGSAPANQSQLEGSAPGAVKRLPGPAA